MKLKLFAILALLTLALCGTPGSLATANDDLAQLPGTNRVAVTRAIDLRSSVQPIATQCDWGRYDEILIRISTVNASARVWQHITGASGCSCAKIVLDQRAFPVDVGGTVDVDVHYRRPSEPGLSPQTIRLDIDGRQIPVRLMLDWRPPLAMTALRQTETDAWQVDGTIRPGWSVESIRCQNRDVQLSKVVCRNGSFQFRLSSSNTMRRTCRLECKLTAESAAVTTTQTLDFVLQSAQPRSIPSTLICDVTDDGKLCGHARLLFPRARYASCPTLVRMVLVTAGGDLVPLSGEQDAIGSSAIKVEFISLIPIDQDALESSWRIRFVFDDGSQLDCPFLVS